MYSIPILIANFHVMPLAIDFRWVVNFSLQTAASSLKGEVILASTSTSTDRLTFKQLLGRGLDTVSDGVSVGWVWSLRSSIITGPV